MSEQTDLIQYREEYVVECDYSGTETTRRFDDVSDANRFLLGLIGTLSDSAYFDRVNEGGEFGGCLRWYADETVPLARFDEVVTEYSDNLHAGGVEDMPLDRDCRFLLVEQNVRGGGYWLTSGDDAGRLVNDHLNQEYADDWEIVDVYDLVNNVTLAVELTATVVEAP